MRRGCVSLALAVVACSKQTPDDVTGGEWHVVQTPHIHLETDLPLRYATERASTLEEELRALVHLYQLLSPRPTPPLRPVQVVLFDDCEQYRTLGEGEGSGGYARPSFDLDDARVVVTCDDVVTDPKWAELYRNTLFRHELAHVLNRYHFRHLKQWLEEGLAEYFSGARILSSVVEIGHPPPTTRGWHSKERTLSFDSLRADAWTRSEGTYHAAWKAAHALLNSSTESRDRTQRFLRRLAAGVSEADAWRETMAPVDEQVRQTYASWAPLSNYKTWKVPLPAKSRFERSVRPMTPVEVASRLVEVAIAHTPEGKLSPRLRQALAHLQTIDRSGETSDLWRALSAFHSRSAELGDPVELFDAYRRRRPDDLRGHLGWFLSSLDKIGHAGSDAVRREILASLRAALPRVVQLARTAYALNAVAQYWVLVDQPRAAVPFLRRALERDPGCSDCYQTLAVARFQEERFGEAVVAQEHAIAAMGDRKPTREMTRRLESYRTAAARTAGPTP